MYKKFSLIYLKDMKYRPDRTDSGGSPYSARGQQATVEAFFPSLLRYEPLEIERLADVLEYVKPKLRNNVPGVKIKFFKKKI